MFKAKIVKFTYYEFTNIAEKLTKSDYVNKKTVSLGPEVSHTFSN